MKAIHTEYNGLLFKSGLEARWAVFFDILGIRYEYKLEGFKLFSEKNKGDAPNYFLPRLYLPDFDCLVAIKPPESPDIQKLHKSLFSFSFERRILLIAGFPNNYFAFFKRPDTGQFYVGRFALGKEDDKEFYITSEENKDIFCFNPKNIGTEYSTDSPKLLNAYKEATLLRFEKKTQTQTDMTVDPKSENNTNPFYTVTKKARKITHPLSWQYLFAIAFMCIFIGILLTEC